MKVTVCQLDNRNDQVVPMLEKLSIHIQEYRSDFLLLPEMCFSDWLAADPVPTLEYWYRAVKDHEIQISKLAELGARAVMGTRPIVRKNRGVVFRMGSSLRFLQSGSAVCAQSDSPWLGKKMACRRAGGRRVLRRLLLVVKYLESTGQQGRLRRTGLDPLTRSRYPCRNRCAIALCYG